MHKRNKGHTDRREILKIKLTKELREFMEKSDEEPDSMKDDSEETVNDYSGKSDEEVNGEGSDEETKEVDEEESNEETDEVDEEGSTGKSENNIDAFFETKIKKPTNISPAKKVGGVRKPPKRKIQKGAIPPSGKKIITKNGQIKQWCSNPNHAAYCPIEEFHFLNKKKGKRMAQCRACRSAYKHGRKDEAYQVELNKKYEYGPTKKCTGLCGEILPTEMFWLKKTNSNGRRDSKCKLCRKLEEPSKQPEYRLMSFRRWYHNRGGKEKCQKSWELYKPTRNERNRQRRKTDAHYKTKELIKNRIYQCLKVKGIHKKNKVKYIGIDLPMYLAWIVYQFDEHMTWENQGTYWQIDHVRPCDSFEFTNEDDDAIFECFHWSNTRPMETTSNIIKSNTVDKQLIKDHRKLARQFMVEYEVKGDNIIAV